jgi:hypothetical protein
MSGNLLMLAMELELCLIAAATLAGMNGARWEPVRDSQRGS